jgi:hypothetical protein
MSIWRRIMVAYTTLRSQVEDVVHTRECCFFYSHAILWVVYGIFMCWYRVDERFRMAFTIGNRETTGTQELIRQATQQRTFSFGLVAMIGMCVPFYVSFMCSYCLKFSNKSKFGTIGRTPDDLFSFRAMVGMFLGKLRYSYPPPPIIITLTVMVALTNKTSACNLFEPSLLHLISHTFTTDLI